MRAGHKISVSSAVRGIGSRELTALIKKCVRGALDCEKVTLPCEISVLLTDDEGIREINREYRQVDKPTDVLSFPMFELKPGQPLCKAEIDPETGLLPLGDIAISMGHARAQALEYGHSVTREVGFLTVHSVLHLLGYDHMDDGEQKRRMQAREKEILTELGIKREDD